MTHTRRELIQGAAVGGGAAGLLGGFGFNPLVTAAMAHVSPEPALALDPVVATQPESRAFALTALPSSTERLRHTRVSPAVVASVSTGMPLWPTVRMTDAGSAGLQLTSLTR